MASTTSQSRPSTCRFCGKALPVRVYRAFGTIIDLPGPCHCDGAEAQRAADEEAERRRHAAEIAEQRTRIYRKAGVRPRFMRAEPDETFLEHVEAGNGLYFVGDTNAGKTHAAVALLKAYINAHTAEVSGALHCNRSARIIAVPDLLSEWKATYNHHDEDEEQVTARYGDADLLVLDDMGKGAPSAWALERLFQLVMRRSDNLLPTVVTTQYEAPDLGRRLAETGDRETARAIVRRLTCDDTRRILMQRRRDG